jgi:hypothetical protein
MASFGNVTSVVERPVGTTLAVAAPAGSSTVTVDDISKLAWPTGGCQIGAQTFTYTVDAAPDQTVDVIDQDEDVAGSDEVGTLQLGAPTTGGPILTESAVSLMTEGSVELDVEAPLVVEEGGVAQTTSIDYGVDEPVIQWQTSAVTERIATVLLPDQQEELVLRVPRPLWDRLPSDIRDAAPETVALENVEGEWVMTDVVDEDPSVDASFINIATLPATQGPLLPVAAVDASTFFDEAWANPTRVTVTDSSYATAIGTSSTATVTSHTTGFKSGTISDDSGVGAVAWVLSGGHHDAETASPPQTSHYLKATDFGFSIPAGATVTGIVAQITRSESDTGRVTDNIVKLVKGGTVSGNDKSNPAEWPTPTDFSAFTGITYGGINDLWGLAFTPANINASDFGVVLSVNLGSGVFPVAHVSDIQLKISYTTVSVTAFRSNTHFLKATNFGFSIPDQATITGITVAVDRKASDNTGDDYVVDNQIRLTNGTDASGDRAITTHWPTAAGVATYGGDLWGQEWTSDDINAASFGVLLSADVNFGVTASVDDIQVSVSYVTAGDA